MNLNSIKKTLFAGMLFILPMAVIAYIFYKIYSFLHSILAPLSEKFDVTMISGKLAVVFLVVFFILFVCFCLGWLLQRASVVKVISDYLQNIVIQLVPSLSYYKSFAENKFDVENDKTWKGILLLENNKWVPAFIVEKKDDWITLFIPQAPKCNIGTVQIMLDEDITYQELPLSKSLESLQAYGQGISSYIAD